MEAAGCCNHIQDDRGTYPHRGVLSPGPHESGGVVSGHLATYGLGCGFINNNDENKKKRGGFGNNNDENKIKRGCGNNEFDLWGDPG